MKKASELRPRNPAKPDHIQSKIILGKLLEMPDDNIVEFSFNFVSVILMNLLKKITY